MPCIDALVIGAGQAGLAMSHRLAARGIEHVVLERGRVAERWRSERWNSLRLLTPSWMSQLPGWSYRGPDPDGFMTMAEVISHLGGYARAMGAPVLTATRVLAVERRGDAYHVETTGGSWTARAVVVATGHCDVPATPGFANRLPAGIRQLTPSQYRDPASLPAGGVLVVGGSASGIQIAEELRLAGREVAISVGRHTRLPRLYRGRDIMWWMDRMGVLSEPAEAVPDLRRARAQPSLQLVGRPDRRTIDLGTLRSLGVRVFGRAGAVEGASFRFHDDLAETTASAWRRLQRLLARIDAHAGSLGWTEPPEDIRPLVLEAPAGALDLRAEGLGTVVWATGYARDYSWLRVPVLDPWGEILHQGGVTPAPGLYVLGLRFLRRRNSNFIDGVGADAEALAAEVAGHLTKLGRVAA